MNTNADSHHVTRLLAQIETGDPNATSELFTMVYEELRRMAAAQVRNEAPGRTLQATALVHEVWLRLVGGPSQQEFANRKHFFVAAAESMRRILVDAARARRRLKRGGGNAPLSLMPHDAVQMPPDDQLLDLDNALGELQELDGTKADLVKLRYFAGMTNAEAAEHLEISTATAERYWAFARSWLKVRMES